MTFGILGLLDLHFGFNGQLMEQSFQFLVFFGEKEQVKPRSLKLVQSVYQVEICQFAVEGDTYNFRGLRELRKHMKHCIAIERALEILEDPSYGKRGDTPDAHASRHTGCSALPSVLPGRWHTPISIFHPFPCTTPLLSVVTTMPKGVLLSLFILKEWTSRCCYSTMSLPSR